jgi:2-polyprenyl-6-methoxyphenol hydroxylase-like FAD-dependent oxidoreductase
VAARIIDRAEEPSPYSKALAINPRTLELLESTGVTKEMLACGMRLRGVRFEMNGKWRSELSLASLKHKYPFMVGLSQATTERLLSEAFEAAGGKVERGIALTTCRLNSGNTVVAELKRSSDGAVETVECSWMLAADGARSAARKALNIEFGGGSFEKPWYLADVPLQTSLAEDWAYVFFLPDGGFRFLIRVVDETVEPSRGAKLWRVIGDSPALLDRIPGATPAGAPVWSSEFHISHRINRRLQVGNVYFAGDAAHIHSPMGARGMNLGLEDAWVFSQLVQTGQIERYDAVRKPVDAAVVKRIELLSRVVVGESWTMRLARPAVMRWLVKLPPVQRRFLAAVTGLDHPLDFGEMPKMGESNESRQRISGKIVKRHAH